MKDIEGMKVKSPCEANDVLRNMEYKLSRETISTRSFRTLEPKSFRDHPGAMREFWRSIIIPGRRNAMLKHDGNDERNGIK